ncbi:hypothetical protein, unlikely [Trypanosoma brucei gambiense DAL972]|uniref:Uncharacterized protein n=1 Tax=Trypanosoma brucei gambiense (strain MHOM/CI/86/DAL972) TaxID=679716 RepID=C9ZKN5_TRYB9|nr:hypothetical protein, unlikely [Trypanosoma brucei gambiense DAL972]CBH10251.1 hypothetical protein, unlikely [Trypanosoma brucei gambiense DAL972]|eukprot:XP_011772541.1 hypothetical protein, unlikely [Trypanosoma brucei gambiense DAL972]
MFCLGTFSHLMSLVLGRFILVTAVCVGCLVRLISPFFSFSFSCISFFFSFFSLSFLFPLSSSSSCVWPLQFKRCTNNNFCYYYTASFVCVCVSFPLVVPETLIVAAVFFFPPLSSFVLLCACRGMRKSRNNVT